MKLSLQEKSGLEEDSGLYMWLGYVDNLLKDQKSWSEIHRKIPVDTMYEGMLGFLGHPTTKLEVEEDEVWDYAIWLAAEGERIFAGILANLIKYTDPNNIRLVMMFILANLEYLKQREGGIRSIDAGWLDE